ncbi:MAG: hypothetical protein QHH07_03310 [Sedimentisphaerales bacterium]|nr:hypothetical protein [Sedimentisphaerales bacterium]
MQRTRKGLQRHLESILGQVCPDIMAIRPETLRNCQDTRPTDPSCHVGGVLDRLLASTSGQAAG